MRKTCWDCKQPRNESSFAFRDKQKGTRHGRCKQCVRTYRNGRYKQNPEGERRAAAKRNGEIRQQRFNVAVRKKLVPCADCGQRFAPWVMQFDHRDGVEKFESVSRLVTFTISEARFLEEIAKCDAVCANCHAERTAQRRFKEQGRGRYGPLMAEIESFLK